MKSTVRPIQPEIRLFNRQKKIKIIKEITYNAHTSLHNLQSSAMASESIKMDLKRRARQPESRSLSDLIDPGSDVKQGTAKTTVNDEKADRRSAHVCD